jgi:hypothetical protein
LKFINLE